MNYIDIIIVIILVWSGFKGFIKGFVISIASLIALLAGIFGAIQFSHLLNGIIPGNDNPLTNQIISFSITFILIVIAVHLLARLLDKIIEAVALGLINRIAGLVFNVLKSVLILSVLLALFTKLNDQIQIIPPSQTGKSLFYKPVSKLAPAIFPFLRFENEKFENNNPEGGEVYT